MKTILALLIFTSCASQQILIKEDNLLPYKESSQMTKIHSGLKNIKLLNVKDKREYKHFGMGFTGAQYQKTPIYFNNSVENVLKNYFDSALSSRGMVVGPSGVPMTIVVHKVWVEEVIEKFSPELATCHVDLEFHIEQQTGSWAGRYWTKFTSPGDLADGTQRLSPTLASCLNEIVEKLVNDKKFIKIMR